jgi:hypothetical protein
VVGVLLDLFPLLCRGLLLATLVVPLAVFSSRLLDDPLITAFWYAALGLFLWGLAALAWRGRWFWRFLGRTRRFRTARGDRVLLRYASDGPGIDAPAVLAEAERALGRLEALFGRLTLFWHGRSVGPLLFRRRVHVYLFPTCWDVAEVFGEVYAGIALTTLHAVVVPIEAWALREGLPHELAHLFTDRWNRWAPPLLREGFSTWLQGTVAGRAIDEVAASLIRQRGRSLLRLLDDVYFFRPENRWPCYVLSASFVGFLLRRFGWDVCRRFYCRVHGSRRFEARFLRHFGLAFEEAGRQWREALLRGG